MNVCLWNPDAGYGYWHSACGESFFLKDSTPYENKMRFCCYCGRSLVEGDPGSAPANPAEPR